MDRRFFYIVVICAFGVLASPANALSQDNGESRTTRTVGGVVNLFETLAPRRPIAGVRLTLPTGWRLVEARLLRYGTEPVSVQSNPGPNGSLLLTTDLVVQGPHELVLRVQVGEQTGTYSWHMTPFVLRDEGESPDSLGRRQFLDGRRRTQQLVLESAPEPDGANRVVDFRGANRPLLLRDPDLPPFGRNSSFTIEYWMKTAALDEIVLSTWSGEEGVTYPVEMVVDRSGRIRSYWAQAGRHQALRSTAPVADDQWHHVALVYDAGDSRLRLVLDGTVADSSRARLQAPSSVPVPLAVGGRIPRRIEAENAGSRYSGRVDEIRIWSEARSVESLNRMKDRPFASVSDSERARGPVRLSFNDPPPRKAVDWPGGARRVPTVLSFQSALRNLRAQTDGQRVTLHWRAEGADKEPFLIERSPDGRSFTPIGRVQPQDTPAPDESRELSYTDEEVPGEVVYYRVRQARPERSGERTTGTIKIGLGTTPEQEAPTQLVGNFPNPFVKSTTIAYRVNESMPITLTVWDLTGHQVATLADDTHKPGYYEQSFTPQDLPSGTYFVRLQTPNQTQSHRMVLLK